MVFNIDDANQNFAYHSFKTVFKLINKNEFVY